MDDLLRQSVTVLRAMWTKRWAGVAAAGVVAVLGGVGVLVYPERYEATAKVYVDTQSVLRPLMTGLAFQPDIDQQVAMLARTLISRPNVERLVQSPQVGVRSSAPGALDAEVDGLMRNINLVPGGKGNLYSISYKDTDSRRAGRIVETLVNMFVDSGISDKRRGSESARRFLDEQIRSHETKLTDAENRLKDFKLQHFGLTGTSNQDHFARISTLSDEVSRLRVELSSAQQSRDALRRELAQEEPQLPPEAISQGNSQPLSETDARLEAQRRQLDDLQRRFTDDHPDVIATKRAIARLVEQKKQEAQERAAATGSKGHGPAATSPVYQKIRSDLAQAEARVAELQGQLGAQSARLEQTRATAGRVPEVEAQLAQLNRDYDVIRRNYEQLVSRRESASLGERIDETSQVADFRVIEPARVSSTPVFPNRVMVGVFAFLAAVAAGLGAAFGLSQLAPSFHSVKALAEASGRPVLGTVSMFVGPAARIAERHQQLRFYGVTAAFLAAHVFWLGWLAMRAKA